MKKLPILLLAFLVLLCSMSILSSCTLSKMNSDYAAYYADHLTSITIPDTVVSIGEYAFSQTGLRSVSIPIGVTHISHNAFAGCESLEEAVFAEPSGWKVIPYKGKFLTTKTLDPADLEDHEAVARYLAETYQNYDWHREG